MAKKRNPKKVGGAESTAKALGEWSHEVRTARICRAGVHKTKRKKEREGRKQDARREFREEGF